MKDKNKKELSYDELCAIFIEDWLGIRDYDQSDLNVETKDMVRRMIDRGWIKGE